VLQHATQDLEETIAQVRLWAGAGPTFRLTRPAGERAQTAKAKITKQGRACGPGVSPLRWMVRERGLWFQGGPKNNSFYALFGPRC
jgi:hypothetical protein